MCFPKSAGVFIYIAQLGIVICHTKARNTRTNPGILLEEGSICQEGTKRRNACPLRNIDEPPNSNKSGGSPEDNKGNPVTLLEDSGAISNVKRARSLPIKRNKVSQGCLEERDRQ